MKQFFVGLQLVFGLAATASIVACAQSSPNPSPAVAPAPAGNADGKSDGKSEGKSESDAPPCIVSSVSKDYEATHEKTTDPWIRDSGSKLSITLVQPIELVGPGRDVGSIALVIFKNGVALPYPEIRDGQISSLDGAICTFSIGYGNPDFDEMLKRRRNSSLKSIYPKLVLPVGTMVAHQTSVMESFESIPVHMMPNKACDDKAQTKESVYDFSFDTPVSLQYPNGKPSESKLYGFSCRGHNQRFSTLRAALGEKVVGSIDR